MVAHPVNPPATGWSLTVPVRLWSELSGHLFRGHDEHGAVILAGLADGPRGPRLLARELIVARDGVDYVPGRYGHRALTATFVRDAAIRAGDERLAYLAVHNHFGGLTVGFSQTDLDSHVRGYPALRQITGQLVGGLVLTPQAAAGDLWLLDGARTELAETVIPAGNLIRLRSTPAKPGHPDRVRDRQARLFGELGQQALGRMRVAVIGLGGIGSVLVELLARLGVGALVLADAELAEDTNLPRMIAAEGDDIGRPKTELAERNARRANQNINLTVLPKRAEDPAVRAEMNKCDWIFLAADSHAARHWTNVATQQYLIPTTQLGVKIPIDRDGNVGEIHAVSRLFLPGNGCLWCNGLIDPTELAIDMHPDHERAAARYVPDVPAPSVIALNTLVAAEAVNHFMLAVTGLHHNADDTDSIIHLPRRRERAPQGPTHDQECMWCSAAGQLGRGQS